MNVLWVGHKSPELCPHYIPFLDAAGNEDSKTTSSNVIPPFVWHTLHRCKYSTKNPFLTANIQYHSVINART